MRRYGLLGKSLKHSFSKRYFSEKFSREGINATYELFELAKIEDFPAWWRQQPSLSGLNVTIPYKEQIIPYLDELSPEAAEVGAVNTILPTPRGLIGHNTDVVGFEESLRNAWQGPWPPAALILGSGGAAKAVVYVLRQRLGIADVRVLSRQPIRPEDLSYDQAPLLEWGRYLLVVNTTPLGMFPEVDRLPDLPYHLFTSRHLAMDLIYNPEVTAFMQAAAVQGAATCNGMEMLLLQAEKAWEIWNAAL